MKRLTIAASLLAVLLLTGCNGGETVSDKDSIDTKGLVNEPYAGKGAAPNANNKPPGP